MESGDHPLKQLYVAGFALNDIKLFQLRGTLGKNLKKQSTLLHGELYYEYYATLAWAQFLTFSLLAVSIISLFATFIGSTGTLLFLLIGILAVAATWNLTLSKMKEQLEKRREECLNEFPDMITKLSLLINSGMVLREAWKLTANGKEGELYSLIKKSCEFMESGDSDISAIYKFGVLSDTQEIKKFSNTIIQGLEKGNVGLADFLTAQASELWEQKRQLVLQKSEIAAGKLIIPLGIMFGGIIMIIIVAAAQSMPF